MYLGLDRMPWFDIENELHDFPKPLKASYEENSLAFEPPCLVSYNLAREIHRFSEDKDEIIKISTSYIDDDRFLGVDLCEGYLSFVRSGIFSHRFSNLPYTSVSVNSQGLLNRGDIEAYIENYRALANIYDMEAISISMKVWYIYKS